MKSIKILILSLLSFAFTACAGFSITGFETPYGKVTQAKDGTYVIIPKESDKVKINPDGTVTISTEEVKVDSNSAK